MERKAKRAEQRRGADLVRDSLRNKCEVGVDGFELLVMRNGDRFIICEHRNFVAASVNMAVGIPFDTASLGAQTRSMVPVADGA